MLVEVLYFMKHSIVFLGPQGYLWTTSGRRGNIVGKIGGEVG